MAGTLSRDEIEISLRAADHFTQLYYTAYDSPHREQDLPNFYRQTSTIVWNGNPCQGPDSVKRLVQGMPKTLHTVQAYDCHPIVGTQPPSLIITVSGNVKHGEGAAKGSTSTPSRSVDGEPRVFSQVFVLVPDPVAPVAKAGEGAKYYIAADEMRFVG